MNYQTIIKDDLVNGEGIRCSLFVSGCSHGCAGCFNESAWDYRSGMKYTEETEQTILNELSKKYVTGLTLLGGDPLMKKNIDSVLNLCIKVKELYPEKNIWCWTGYTLEEVQNNHAHDVLKYVDVLVDGKFEESEKDLTLAHRGSRNQRVLKKGIDFGR